MNTKVICSVHGQGRTCGNGITFGLITDFGFDFAVASMKGVILQSLACVRIVDIDHSLPKFNVMSAAFVINKVYRYFPKNTIFICVIDPGVGGQRKVLAIEIDGYTFIGPNNGIFHFLLNDKVPKKVVRIVEKAINPESRTFHGRDLFVPAAIKKALGQQDCFAPFNLKDITRIDIPNDQGVIAYIDSFGNIKTNILFESLHFKNEHIFLDINGKTYRVKLVKCFNDVASGTLVGYRGSNNTLEIAVNLGSARDVLRVKVGDRLVIHASEN